MGALESYIRQAALARGIDPEIAVRVARSEGGLDDPTRQSLVRKNGAQEPSYGPFQLLIGGGSTGFPEGMGNAALALGVDPRDPAQWQKGVDFALDNAARAGWGAWFGAKASGIGRFDGIRGRAANDVPDGPKGQESYPVFGGVPAMSSNPTPTESIPAFAQAAAKSGNGGISDVLGMMAMAQSQGPQFSPVQIMGPTGDQANGLLKLVQALKGGAA